MADQQIRDKHEVLRSELLNSPNVKTVSSATTKPGLGIGKLIMNVESNEGMVERGVDFYMADYDFVETMQMHMVEGRNFSRDYATDTAAVIINEAMAKRMNWDNPIGKKIQRGGGENAPMFTVVGVVKDYHQLSLYNLIEPLAIFFRKDNYFLHIKIAPQDVPNTLQHIEKTWNDINPGKPRAYTFLDQDFFSQYQADQRRGQIFTTFSALTILIACLGLLGLASYTTEQRTKEIGIRKVIGASVSNVVMLLYKDFFILVAIAILLAFPVAYYFMDRWLQTFAYQTDIKALTFVLAALLTLFITLLAVGFHTIRAATANPVKALQSE
jgi:putative ABC transport system permease protein